jgi:CrcB protein
LRNILLIALGGAFGCVARFLLANAVYTVLGRSFPYGTLVVNMVGCFLMGFLFVILLERFAVVAEQLRALLLIGFLGGLTTFSTFSIETINLMENGDVLRVATNIIGSVCLCLFVTWIGVMLARQF